MPETGPHAPRSEEFRRAVSDLAGATSEELSRTTTPDGEGDSPPDTQLDEDEIGSISYNTTGGGDGEGAGQVDAAAGTAEDTTSSGSKDELIKEVGPTRIDRFYEKLGSMLPPEGSIKRGLKNFTQINT